MEYSIYTLSDPRDGSVRYVGMSKNAQNRYQQHLTRSDSNRAKGEWINKLIQLRLQPVLTVIDTLPDKASARKSESEWIMRYYMNGSPITNWNMSTPTYKEPDSNETLAMAIAQVEQTQSKSLYAAGIAYFLQDAGFDFEEISEYLDKRDNQK